MNKLLEIDLQLLQKVKEANKKKINLEKTDIPASYANLFLQYSSNDDLESLKRALFIQWYAVAEPIEFTGIGELGLENQKKNLFKIKEIILNDSYDSELVIMFKHYYDIADWYFDSFTEFKSLISNMTIPYIKIITENRGIMGQYWDSIF